MLPSLWCVAAVLCAVCETALAQAASAPVPAALGFDTDPRLLYVSADHDGPRAIF